MPDNEIHLNKRDHTLEEAKAWMSEEEWYFVQRLSQTLCVLPIPADKLENPVMLRDVLQAAGVWIERVWR